MLASKPNGWLGAYGLRCQVGRGVDVNGQTVLLVSNEEPTIAMVSLRENGEVAIEQAAIDHVTIGYVNRFLAGTGKEVKLNWRSKTDQTLPRYYLTKSGRKQRRTKAAPTTSVPAPATFSVPLAPQVAASPTPTESKAATITVAAAGAPSGHPLANIPGIVMPSASRPKMKGAGNGWSVVDGIVMTDDTVQEFLDCKKFADMPPHSTRPLVGLLITGPAGTAKTTMAITMANYLGLPSLVIDGQSIRTADDWWGGMKPVGDRFAFQWSPFAQALRTGEPFMAIIDELTRTESTAALNGIMGLIAPQGKATVADANTEITLPKGVMVVATANIGPEFVGTLPLDGAVRGRFVNGIRADFPSPAIEAAILSNLTGLDTEVSKTFVATAAAQRINRDAFPSGNILSTRTLIQAAHKVTQANRTPRSAMLSVMRGQFDPSDDKELVTLIEAHFPKDQVATPPESPQPATINVVGAKHRYSGVGANPCNYKFPGTSQSCGMLITDLTVHWP